MTAEINLISISIFTVVSLVSILLHDFKYLLFLNGHNRLKAVIVCGIYTVFNTIITKRIAEVDLTVSCTIITITNMASMWIAMWYSEKNLKEYIFKFEISTKYNDIRFALKDKFIELNIPYQYQFYFFQNDKNSEQEKSEGITYNEFGESLYHKYDVYCFSRRHSKQLENILNTYDRSMLKYNKINTSNYKE